MYSKDLKSHHRIHTVGNLSKCKTCNKFFSSCCTGINEKDRTDIAVKPYECSICDSIFCCNDNLLKHKEAHSDNNQSRSYHNFKCLSCEKSPTSKRNLTIPENQHSVTSEDIKCDFCQKSFSSIDQLKSHEKEHLPKKDFICDLCDKGFIFSSSLDKHKKDCVSRNHIKCEDTIKEEIEVKSTLDEDPLNIQIENDIPEKEETIILIKDEIKKPISNVDNPVKEEIEEKSTLDKDPLNVHSELNATEKEDGIVNIKDEIDAKENPILNVEYSVEDKVDIIDILHHNIKIEHSYCAKP